MGQSTRSETKHEVGIPEKVTKQEEIAVDVFVRKERTKKKSKSIELKTPQISVNTRNGKRLRTKLH